MMYILTGDKRRLDISYDASDNTSAPVHDASDGEPASKRQNFIYAVLNERYHAGSAMAGDSLVVTTARHKLVNIQ